MGVLGEFWRKRLFGGGSSVGFLKSRLKIVPINRWCESIGKRLSGILKGSFEV